MKGSSSKSSGGISDLEGPFSARGENGGLLAGGAGPQLEFNEQSTRERTVARLRLLWDHRRLLGRVAGLAFVLSCVVALLIPNRYQSAARLMPPDNQSGSELAMAAMAFTGASGGGSSTGGSGGLGGLASQLLGLKSTSDLLVGVLSSRTIADRLIDKFNLQKVYRDRRIEDTRKELARRTDTSVDRKSQIITITVTDRDPHRAAAMAETYVEELNRVLAQVSTSSARRERIFLESRLKTVTQDLETAEKTFSQFASKNSTIDIKEQGKAMVEAAAGLQGQLIAARSELEGLRQIYADSNVRVRSLQARINELENQLRQVGGQDDGPLGQNSTQDDSLYPSIKKLPLLGVTYADLYRETKVQEAVYEMLTQEYEMAKVQEAKEIPTVKVLDPPDIPDKKSFPPRTLIVLLATMFAIACAVTWVFGRDLWEGVDPADPGKLLAQEIYATAKAAIPWSSRNGFEKDLGSKRSHPAPKDNGRRQDHDV